MRKLLIAVALFASLCSTAIAGPKEDAFDILEKWTKAFMNSDVDGIVALYAPDALLLGTGSKTIVVKPDDIRKYFEGAFLNFKQINATLVSHSAIILSDTAVVVTGMDNITGVRDGKPINNNGRVTFVVAKRGANWQIVHFHRSAMPN